MSELTNRIDTILTNSGKRRIDLYKAIELPESSYRQWVRGSIPNAEVLYKVSCYLGSSMEFLVSGLNEKPIDLNTLTLQEKELIDHYRSLSDGDKHAVSVLARGLDIRNCKQ